MSGAERREQVWDRRYETTEARQDTIMGLAQLAFSAQFYALRHGWGTFTSCLVTAMSAWRLPQVQD